MEMIKLVVEEGLLDQSFSVITLTMPKWVWGELQSQGVDQYDLLWEGIPEEYQNLIEIDETVYRCQETQIFDEFEEVEL